MDFKPQNYTISALLSSKCHFKIPRYQREYSWEEQHYKEFIDDMLNSLYVEDNAVKTKDYFMGTMLFIGDLSNTGNDLDVVDGQQRLTIFTILFSALSNHFDNINESKLSERIFEYIMTQDNDGNPVRILKSETHYPFFSYYIQKRDKKDIPEKITPTSEEEECIKETYDYFHKRLEEKNIRDYLLKKNKDFENIEYVELLKKVRDQVLKSRLIVITTNNKVDANAIFEILNGKGKRLTDVDLIKNRLFSVLSTTEPVDEATLLWNNAKNNLNRANKREEFPVFFRQYWLSKYGDCTTKNLFSKFLKQFDDSDKDAYTSFLKDLEYNSEIYSFLLNPNLSYFDNRKEYKWLIQSIKYMINEFDLVQVRIVLMTLIDAKKNKKISHKNLKSIVTYLEKFLCTYQVICKGRANTMLSPLSSFSRKIRKSQNDSEILYNFNEFKKKIKKYYPTYEEFYESFKLLEYRKVGDSPTNMKTKYIINKIFCYYQKDIIFPNDGSIEHIVNECTDSNSVKIGNLILLEEYINNECDSLEYKEKLNKYVNSRYVWLKLFCDKYTTWTISDIDKRTEKLAKLVYTDVLKI